MMTSTARGVSGRVVSQLWAILLGRDHLRALAQRVEVADGEVRIMGSKSRLLQVLIGKNGVNTVPTQGPKWRMGCPLDARCRLPLNVAHTSDILRLFAAGCC
jgi:hypothetical protein